MSLIPHNQRRRASARRRRAAEPDGMSAERLLALAALLAAVTLMCARAASADAAPRLPAPQQVAPAAGTPVASLPSFSWRRVAGAAKYEFQLSADKAFESIVGQGAGSFKTVNTYATVDKAVAEGDYFWRVRAIDAHDRSGRWSAGRQLLRRWTVTMSSPVDGATLDYPGRPIMLTWKPVPGAYKYLVNVATDESMAHSILGGSGTGVETSSTSGAIPLALTASDCGASCSFTYYWTVVPLDAQRHSGTRPTPFRFTVTWSTTTTPRVTNLMTGATKLGASDADFAGLDGVVDPQFWWDPVPGAASYQVEVNPADDWAVGSKVCCDDRPTGAALSPLALLPNNTYHWRVRALSPEGRAGVWNYGPDFKKGFRDVAPRATVDGLRVRDNVADRVPPAGPTGLPTTDSPVIRWDPTPGASSYEIQLAPWDDSAAGHEFCNWSQPLPSSPSSVGATTTSTAWTAFGFTSVGRPLGQSQPMASTSLWKLWQDESYCVRVRARTDRDAKLADVVSDWTQIGGVGHPAFHYVSHFPSGCSGTATSMPASAYHDEAHAATWRRNPLLTWDWVPGACGYYVVVARDAEFTNIVDVGFTNYPDYAPRGSIGPMTYTDENTHYYWAVLPTRDTNGNGLSTQPQQDAPQTFDKLSIPPRLIGPAPDAVVTDQPTFRWTPVEGALDYRIQVDDDPNFSSPIDDVRTHSTGFTSTKTYAAYSSLYWRVRADAENGLSAGTAVGLGWSARGVFHRDLRIPANPRSDLGPDGQTVPTFSWDATPGAVSYDVHFEQADGTKRDFTVRSTAFTPTAYYGTGVWRWQVRANYQSGFVTVSSGYTPMQSFTRHIASPRGLTTTAPAGSALLSWAPAPMAKQYKVQISTSDSFATLVDQAIVDGTSFAPHMTQPQWAQPGALYWRVATVDEGGNLSGWSRAILRQPLPMTVSYSGALRRGRTGTLRFRVRDRNARGLGGVTVRATATGMKAKGSRTGRSGTAVLRLRPSRKGAVKVVVSSPGYRTRTLSIRVR